jgi:hypothetical protein
MNDTTGCAPQPMAVKDLRCGDMVHAETWLGVDHWFTFGPARPSYPVPGKWHVTRSGRGTHAVFTSLDDVVMVCGTVPCSPLCAYEHRPAS